MVNSVVTFKLQKTVKESLKFLSPLRIVFSQPILSASCQYAQIYGHFALYSAKRQRFAQNRWFFFALGKRRHVFPFNRRSLFPSFLMQPLGLCGMYFSYNAGKSTISHTKKVLGSRVDVKTYHLILIFRRLK